MRITIIMHGKTAQPFLIDGVALYLKRANHFIRVRTKIIGTTKGGNKPNFEKYKKEEAQILLPELKTYDRICLLDERGKEYDSMGLAKMLQNTMNTTCQELAFVIGGAYGFHQSVYDKADDRISLSRLTFSHQLVRLVFAEQLYRALTIINGRPYHH